MRKMDEWIGLYENFYVNFILLLTKDIKWCNVPWLDKEDAFIIGLVVNTSKYKLISYEKNIYVTIN